MKCSLSISNFLEKIARVRSWYPTSVNVENDKEVVTWIEEHYDILEEKLKSLKLESFALNLAKNIRNDHDNSMKGLEEVVRMLSTSDKARLNAIINPEQKS